MDIFDELVRQRTNVDNKLDENDMFSKILNVGKKDDTLVSTPTSINESNDYSLELVAEDLSNQLAVMIHAELENHGYQMRLEEVKNHSVVTMKKLVLEIMKI